ncbi:MAG: hypothetical protein EOM19_07770 [Candidatus Moranbacteria bacterium]|jgi:dephospho-CoA kinase|nr:hypothetical protein [Candidatus Moranbacteria bacterium]
MKSVILGLAGAMGSGKGTVSHYLVDKYGFSKFRMSDVFRDIVLRLHIEESRENISLVSRVVREAFGQDVLSKVIAEDVEKVSGDAVIDGIRRKTDIEHLKKNPQFFLIYIDVDIQCRYNRLVLRAENTGDSTKTFEDFLRDQKLEAENQVECLRDLSHYTLENNGDIQHLYSQIDAIVKTIKSIS